MGQEVWESGKLEEEGKEGTRKQEEERRDMGVEKGGRGGMREQDKQEQEQEERRK